MKIEEVKALVEEIRILGEEMVDDEAAHAKEDDLYVAVLAAIASGTSNAKELAEEALKVSKYDFQRWCA